MVHPERGDPVAVALELVVRLELHELDREGHPSDHRIEQLEQARQAARPVDGERALALPQRERLQHPRQAEHVVRVEVRDEQLLELDQPDRAHQLPLRALAAVDQQAIAAAPNERGGQPAPRARRGAGGAEEENVEVHRGPMLTRRRARGGRQACA